MTKRTIGFNPFFKDIITTGFEDMSKLRPANVLASQARAKKNAASAVRAKKN